MEFSVEIDPNEIGPARLDALAAAGLNRASIGVQDFDPASRRSSAAFKATRSRATRSRNCAHAGITSLNADILFGLPNQTQQKDIRHGADAAVAGPDRVALYGYAHVPWMARRQAMIPTDALPRPEERLDLFETARRLFKWDGYAEIGIDHFAKPGDGLAKAAQGGHLRRNFQGYTDDTCDALIGLGASSISKFPQGFAQNAAGTADYQKAVRAGHSFPPGAGMRSRAMTCCAQG